MPQEADRDQAATCTSTCSQSSGGRSLSPARARPSAVAPQHSPASESRVPYLLQRPQQAVPGLLSPRSLHAQADFRQGSSSGPRAGFDVVRACRASVVDLICKVAGGDCGVPTCAGVTPDRVDGGVAGRVGPGRVKEDAAVDGASANVEPLERTGRCAAAGGLSVITASVG